MSSVEHHYPLHRFANSTAGSGDDSGGSVLVILNCKLYGLESTVKNHWQHFSTCVCCDGGTNRLHDSLSAKERYSYTPQFICGDLDSARPEVLDFYQKKGTTVVRLPDQDYTDFTKTVQHLLALRRSGELQFASIYALNAAWGRFDQTLANINTLYSEQGRSDHEGVQMFLISEDSILFLLRPGSHVIHVDSGLEEGHCGLVPLGQPCASCTTTGLAWNLKRQSMQVGGLISTSNLLDAGVKHVSVDTSHMLLWTMSHKLVKKIE